MTITSCPTTTHYPRAVCYDEVQIVFSFSTCFVLLKHSFTLIFLKPFSPHHFPTTALNIAITLTSRIHSQQAAISTAWQCSPGTNAEVCSPALLRTETLPYCLNVLVRKAEKRSLVCGHFSGSRRYHTYTYVASKSSAKSSPRLFRTFFCPFYWKRTHWMIQRPCGHFTKESRPPSYHCSHISLRNKSFTNGTTPMASPPWNVSSISRDLLLLLQSSPTRYMLLRHSRLTKKILGRRKRPLLVIFYLQRRAWQQLGQLFH